MCVCVRVCVRACVCVCVFRRFVFVVPDHTIYGFFPRSLTNNMALDQEKIHKISQRISGLSRIGIDKWLAAEEKDLQQAFVRCDVKGIFGFVRKCSKKKDKVQTRMQREDGSFATSYQEDREVFQNYFSKVFGGVTMTFSELIAEDRLLKTVDVARFCLPPINPRLVPTIHELAQVYAHRPCFKGIGEDKIGSEVYRLFPEVMATCIHPLAVKVTAQCNFPIQHRGGMCHELYKNSGTYSIPKHYRDVLLADEGGKGIQKSIRGEFNSFSGVSTTSTQWGSGLHYGSTEVAHLYIKSVFDLARVQQKAYTLHSQFYPHQCP